MLFFSQAFVIFSVRIILTYSLICICILFNALKIKTKQQQRQCSFILGLVRIHSSFRINQSSQVSWPFKLFLSCEMLGQVRLAQVRSCEMFNIFRPIDICPISDEIVSILNSVMKRICYKKFLFNKKFIALILIFVLLQFI